MGFQAGRPPGRGCAGRGVRRRAPDGAADPAATGLPRRGERVLRPERERAARAFRGGRGPECGGQRRGAHGGVRGRQRLCHDRRRSGWQPHRSRRAPPAVLLARGTDDDQCPPGLGSGGQRCHRPPHRQQRPRDVHGLRRQHHRRRRVEGRKLAIVASWSGSSGPLSTRARSSTGASKRRGAWPARAGSTACSPAPTRLRPHPLRDERLERGRMPGRLSVLHDRQPEEHGADGQSEGNAPGPRDDHPGQRRVRCTGPPRKAGMGEGHERPHRPHGQGRGSRSGGPLRGFHARAELQGSLLRSRAPE